MLSRVGFRKIVISNHKANMYSLGVHCGGADRFRQNRTNHTETRLN